MRCARRFTASVWATCPTSCRASRSPRPLPKSSTRDPAVEGLILHRHGIFTFGADARESYERMIEHVTLAEERLERGRKAVFAARSCRSRSPAAEVAPILRGACA